MSRIEDVIQTLDELKDDDVPRRFQERIDEMIMVLREDIDVVLRVDRVRSILDDLENDQNIPMHVRTQLWSISASLEML